MLAWQIAAASVRSLQVPGRPAVGRKLPLPPFDAVTRNVEVVGVGLHAFDVVDRDRIGVGTHARGIAVAGFTDAGSEADRPQPAQQLPSVVRVVVSIGDLCVFSTCRADQCRHRPAYPC
jgi:hypothetical protein